MKLPSSLLQQQQQQACAPRRTTSFRTPADTASSASSALDSFLKSPANLFWFVLHTLCCLISLILGFRFSRLVFFLLFTSPQTSTLSVLRASTDLPPPSFLPRDSSAAVGIDGAADKIAAPAPPNRTMSRVVVGRHGIRIRPWPHPNPVEVMKAHRIIERVQREQRAQFGAKAPRQVIAVTPTYVRTFQALHLTGVAHSLMLVPHDVTWIVVEAGGATNETAALVARSGLRAMHLPFEERMPESWEGRHRTEARMRLRALRIIREERMDGIVVFADDSNMHSMELFDEIQSVKWMGAVSVGILAHSGNSESVRVGVTQNAEEGAEENVPVPVQGPACNSSGQLAGWHTFNSLPYMEKSATYIDDGATVLPRKLEWAGFVLNSRILWKDAEDKPEWVQDLDSMIENGDDVDSPLALLKDASHVEPLGKCGKKIMLWWLRVEARADSKFPSGLVVSTFDINLDANIILMVPNHAIWKIDPPLDITVAAKRTPWPDAPPELQSTVRVTGAEEHAEKHHRKSKSSRLRSSRSKRKHESQIDGQETVSIPSIFPPWPGLVLQQSTDGEDRETWKPFWTKSQNRQATKVDDHLDLRGGIHLALLLVWLGIVLQQG
ncbi:Beta-1,4-xylosyltransferase irx14 [Asimina triloba]